MEEKQFNAGKAWLVVIIAIIAQVTFAIGLMKVPANMGLVMAGFGVDPVAAGNLMNANGIVALIISLPAGMIMQRLGARNVLIAALAITMCGNLLGIFAGADNFSMLIASRAIEGFGYGMQVVTTPQLISEWFPAQLRGLPNGIDSIWFGIGQLVILNVAAQLPGVQEGVWLGSWWFTIICMAVLLVLVIIFVRSPSAQENQLEMEEAPEGSAKASIVAGLASPTTWLLLFIFFLFGYVNSAFASYYPTYLQQDFGMDMATSNGMTSVATIAMLISGFVGGIILNKVKVTKRPMYLLILSVLVGIMGLVMFNLPSTDALIPFLVVFGFVLQLFPGTAYSVAPEAAASPETVPTTMGVLGIGQNFAGVFGTLITSLVMVNMGNSWQAATIPNGIFMVLGVVCAIAMVPLMKKQYVKFKIAD
ncbi:MAG: MFS transporter [Coriobacteriaceae bacterium]|jgi:MFS family permease|nr:MFS transporter [Coriobacteriaceae bacterium]